jgi:hypothetical protein
VFPLLRDSSRACRHSRYCGELHQPSLQPDGGTVGGDASGSRPDPTGAARRVGCPPDVVDEHRGLPRVPDGPTSDW